MKVFLSSTYIDLIEYRKAVVNALRMMGEDVDHMEIFGARDEEPTKVSIEELNNCDVLIGVYAYRYGTIPKDSKTSVTEQEYLHASEREIPILIFVVDESYPWLPKLMDQGLAKINKFKSMVTKEHTPEYFTSPDNLASKVVASIGRLAKKLKPKPAVDSSSPIPYSPPRPKGSTLPNQPYYFGRERELEIIADAISPESRTWGALIDGPGGIGKTALAIRAAYLAPANLFARKIFITAKVRELTPQGEKFLVDFSRDDYFSMLNELALELGEEAIPRLAPNERANPLRMALVGKKTLIVFDNLETLQEDERARLFQFLSRLPEGNKAIVTSRRRVDVDARVLRLNRLSLQEAIQLIAELGKYNSYLAATNPRELQSLYEITNGNPLLIKWIAGQLGRAESQCRTIADAVNFMRNAPKGNDPLEFIFGDLSDSFTGSEAAVLAAISHFTKPAKVEWIAELADISEPAALTALEDLTYRSLLVSDEESKLFSLPSLAAYFIRSKRTSLITQTGDRLANRAYALSLENGYRNYENFSYLDKEWTRIFDAFPSIIEGRNSRLQRFCESLYNFLYFTGRWDSLIVLCQQAEKKALSINDYLTAGWRAWEISIVLSRRNENGNYIDTLNRIIGCWKKAKITWIEKARLLEIEGILLSYRGDYIASKAKYQEAIELVAANEPNSGDYAHLLDVIAGLELSRGEEDSARQKYNTALQIAEQRGDNSMIAIEKLSLSGFAARKGQWPESERLANEALKLYQNLGNLVGIADCYVLLSNSMNSQNRADDALSLILQAIKIYEQIKHADLEFARSIRSKIETSKHS